MIQTAIPIKSWLARTPAVDEVRPAQCVGCKAASRPVGGRLVVHGQGILARQVRGVLEVDSGPSTVVVAVRRYECQRCHTVMTVVPAGVLARRLYSASSIALALHLWLSVALSDREVRERICAWQVRGACARGWAQLYRWARNAGRLFGFSYEMSAERALTTLQALAPVAMNASPLAHQVFEGACRTR